MDNKNLMLEVYNCMTTIADILKQSKEHQTLSNNNNETVTSAVEQHSTSKIEMLYAPLSQTPTSKQERKSDNDYSAEDHIVSEHLHYDPLTEDNFHNAHLCNRNIDEIPNLNQCDMYKLKAINMNSIRDLLGRYLIHDTPEEFQQFLKQTFNLSKTSAQTITRLLHQWVQYNVDCKREHR